MLSALLQRGLSHKNSLVRKGSTVLLGVPKWYCARRAAVEEFAKSPPVLANSVPKSGTHLLAQIVAGLPDRRNYGAFLSSMTSSFRFQMRTPASWARVVSLH